MARCIQPEIAEGFRHGRLPDGELIRALKHAAGCSDCRRVLFANRPEPELGHDAMSDIQDRLTAWRAARRAPLMPSSPWHKGREVDRYVIIRSVGGTDDGVVYEAFDTEREDRVVVKQLDLRVDDPGAPALMSVAHKLCQLSHPNVLQMLSVGVHAGFVYVVYELVKGTPLSQSGSDDPAQLIQLFAAAGRGLAAAHDAGIVHGCFSTASCVVARDGAVRVLNFGVGEARSHRASPSRRSDDWTFTSSQLASEDSFVGFVPNRRRPTSGEFESIVLAAGPNALGPRIYAAPELVLGEPPSAASDQFAFCAALFHRLYGHPPFDGDTMALWLRALLKGQLELPAERADIPPRVQAALLRGLARDPAARFDGMASLIAELQRGRPALGRKGLVGAIVAGAAVAAVGVIVISALRSAPAGAADPSSCNEALAGWDGIWSASRQAALGKATGASGDAWPVLHKRLDAWVGSWRAATLGFCRLPERVSLDCTSNARTAAADLLQLVEDAPQSRIVRAAAATEALPTAADCTASAPSPATAPIAAVKADVRRRLGLLDDADQLTAQPPDDPLPRSYLSLVRGHTAADRGDLIEARRLFESATFDAQAARQPELGAAAAIQRLALSCSPAERALWSGYLAAQLPRTGHAAAQTAYHGALAQSLLCDGKISDAAALRQQVAQSLRGDDSAAAGAAASDLARARLAQADLVDAEAAARDAAAIYAQTLGVHHPLAQTARLLLAEAQLGSAATSAAATIDSVLAELAGHKEADAVRARALLLQGRLAAAHGHQAEALHLVQRAGQEYEAALGGAHPELAAALLLAGDYLLAADRDAEAEASYRQVAAIFDTLGQSESSELAHARAGIQLARWGNRLPPDASELLQWGLAPTGDAIDPAVAAWVAEQLARRSVAHGDPAAALAHYRAAAAAWQDSGDQLSLAGALTEGALLAVQVHAADARAMLERALQLPIAPDDKPRLQGALARLLWPQQRDRARALARAAISGLPDGSPDAADLQQWLARHDAER